MSDSTNPTLDQWMKEATMIDANPKPSHPTRKEMDEWRRGNLAKSAVSRLIALAEQLAKAIHGDHVLPPVNGYGVEACIHCAHTVAGDVCENPDCIVSIARSLLPPEDSP